MTYRSICDGSILLLVVDFSISKEPQKHQGYVDFSSKSNCLTSSSNQISSAEINGSKRFESSKIKQNTGRTELISSLDFDLFVFWNWTKGCNLANTHKSNWPQATKVERKLKQKLVGWAGNSHVVSRGGTWVKRSAGARRSSCSFIRPSSQLAAGFITTFQRRAVGARLADRSFLGSHQTGVIFYLCYKAFRSPQLRKKGLRRNRR